MGTRKQLAEFYKGLCCVSQGSSRCVQMLRAVFRADSEFCPAGDFPLWPM